MYSHLAPLVAAARTADDIRRAGIVGHIAGSVLAPDDAGRRTSRVRLAGRASHAGDVGSVCDGSARRPARA
jgi:hypothetical protein